MPRYIHSKGGSRAVVCGKGLVVEFINGVYEPTEGNHRYDEIIAALEANPDVQEMGKKPKPAEMQTPEPTLIRAKAPPDAPGGYGDVATQGDPILIVKNKGGRPRKVSSADLE